MANIKVGPVSVSVPAGSEHKEVSASLGIDGMHVLIAVKGPATLEESIKDHIDRSAMISQQRDVIVERKNINGKEVAIVCMGLATLKGAKTHGATTTVAGLCQRKTCSIRVLVFYKEPAQGNRAIKIVNDLLSSLKSS